jgi:hypothetical protein
MSVVIFIVFAVLVLVCAVLSALFYYHVRRYSYIGDASKRVFLIYAMVTILVIVTLLSLLIINHIL